MSQVSIARLVRLLDAYLDKPQLKLLCSDLSQMHRMPRTIDTTLSIVEYMSSQLLITLGYRNDAVDLTKLADAAHRISCNLLASELGALNTVSVGNVRETSCIENIENLLSNSTHWSTLQTICKLLKINFPNHTHWDIELWLKQIRDFGDDLERLGNKMERDYRSSKENPARRNLNLESLVEALVITTF